MKDRVHIVTHLRVQVGELDTRTIYTTSRWCRRVFHITQELTKYVVVIYQRTIIIYERRDDCLQISTTTRDNTYT